MQGQKQYQEQLYQSFQLSTIIPRDNFYRRLNSSKLDKNAFIGYNL
jgi:hypothetical protein